MPNFFGKILEEECQDQNEWRFPNIPAHSRFKKWLEFEYFHSRFLKKAAIQITARSLDALISVLASIAEGAIMSPDPLGIGIATGAVKGAIYGVTKFVPGSAFIDTKSRRNKVSDAKSKIKKTNEEILTYLLFQNEYLLNFWPGYQLNHSDEYDEDFKKKIYFKPPKSGKLNLQQIIYPKIKILSEEISEKDLKLESFDEPETIESHLNWALIWDAFGALPMLDYLYFNYTFFDSLNRLDDKIFNPESEITCREFCRAMRFYYLGQNFFLDDFFKKILPQIEFQIEDTINILNLSKSKFQKLIPKESNLNPFSFEDSIHNQKEQPNIIKDIPFNPKIAELKKFNDKKLKKIIDFVLSQNMNAKRTNKCIKESICTNNLNGLFNFKNLINYGLSNTIKIGELVHDKIPEIIRGQGGVLQTSVKGPEKMLSGGDVELSEDNFAALGCVFTEKILTRLIDGIVDPKVSEKFKTAQNAMRKINTGLGTTRLCLGTINFITYLIPGTSTFYEQIVPTMLDELSKNALEGLVTGSPPILSFFGGIGTIVSSFLRTWATKKMDTDTLNIVDDFVEISNTGLAIQWKKAIPNIETRTAIYEHFPRVLRHMFISTKSLDEIQNDIIKFSKKWTTHEELAEQFNQVKIQLQSLNIAGSVASKGAARFGPRLTPQEYVEAKKTNAEQEQDIIHKNFDIEYTKILIDLHELSSFIYYSKIYHLLLEEKRRHFLSNISTKFIQFGALTNPTDLIMRFYLESLTDKQRNSLGKHKLYHDDFLVLDLLNARTNVVNPIGLNLDKILKKLLNEFNIAFFLKEKDDFYVLRQPAPNQVGINSFVFAFVEEYLLHPTPQNEDNFVVQLDEVERYKQFLLSAAPVDIQNKSAITPEFLDAIKRNKKIDVKVIGGIEYIDTFLKAQDKQQYGYTNTFIFIRSSLLDDEGVFSALLRISDQRGIGPGLLSSLRYNDTKLLEFHPHIGDIVIIDHKKFRIEKMIYDPDSFFKILINQIMISKSQFYTSNLTPDKKAQIESIRKDLEKNLIIEIRELLVKFIQNPAQNEFLRKTYGIKHLDTQLEQLKKPGEWNFELFDYIPKLTALHYKLNLRIINSFSGYVEEYRCGEKTAPYLHLWYISNDQYIQLVETNL